MMNKSWVFFLLLPLFLLSLSTKKQPTERYTEKKTVLTEKKANKFKTIEDLNLKLSTAPEQVHFSGSIFGSKSSYFSSSGDNTLACEVLNKAKIHLFFANRLPVLKLFFYFFSAFW